MIRFVATLFVCMACVLPASAQTTPPKEILEKDYLYEVVRHLYRWYLDETDAEKIVGKKEVLFWVKEVTPKLDPGDKSRFGKIEIPQMAVSVTVKKADYKIEELDLVVKNDRFKIINVARGMTPKKADGYTVVKTSYEDMRDYGHRTRVLARFPEDEMLIRLRVTARQEIKEYLEGREKAGLENKIGSFEELLKVEHVMHLSPLSKVANEVWIFWETGRMLVRFASDIDLENPAVWDHEDLAVKLYNIDEQTVVSLDEVAGSNAYMTRDQVGRALFNCIILGKRLVQKPEDEIGLKNEKPE